MAATDLIHNFCGPKNFVRNYSTLTITFPTIWRRTSDHFKVLLKFKIVSTDQLHTFCGRKNLEVRNYSNFAITFPTLWRCPCGFMVLLKFKIAATYQLLNFCEFNNLLSDIFKSHFPQYGNVLANFSRFY